MSTILLACEMSALCSSLSILWHCLSLGLERKLTFSSPMAIAQFSKLAGILSAALLQHQSMLLSPATNMGSIKERNGMDLTEAEDIKKRWHEYTEELYKKDLQDPDNHDGVITNLQPDILECEVKWALEIITMNKDSRGDGIPDELFQILKDDAVKMLHSICRQIWKTQQWPQDWKRSVFIPIPKKGNAKECSNNHTIALFSYVT